MLFRSELVPYQRGDPISFCDPNVELVNVGDKEEHNRVINVEVEEQLNVDGTVGDEEQLSECHIEMVEDDNVS